MSIPKWVNDLPEWATYSEETKRNYVVIDPDGAYPAFLDGEKPTQEKLEKARKKFSRMLRKEIVPEGTMLNIRILAGDKKWALKNYPVE